MVHFYAESSHADSKSVRDNLPSEIVYQFKPQENSSTNLALRIFEALKLDQHRRDATVDDAEGAKEDAIKRSARQTEQRLIQIAGPRKSTKRKLHTCRVLRGRAAEAHRG